MNFIGVEPAELVVGAADAASSGVPILEHVAASKAKGDGWVDS